MSKTLAIITFAFCLPEQPQQCVIGTYSEPAPCAEIGDAVRAEGEARGFIVDYHCEPTGAPIKSLRPRSRPIST